MCFISKSYSSHSFSDRYYASISYSDPIFIDPRKFHFLRPIDRKVSRAFSDRQKTETSSAPVKAKGGRRIIRFKKLPSEWADQLGNTYKGSVKHGLPNGKGTLISSDGTVYTGYFKEGFLHRQGKIDNTTTGKGIYEGELCRGVPQGKGTLLLANGDIYGGDFKNGKFEGKGSFVWKGKAHYKGDFSQGLNHGKGELFEFSENGTSRYTGEFKQGKKNGQGVITYNSVGLDQKTSFSCIFLNNHPMPNSSNLGDQFFLELLTGRNLNGGFETYPMAILASYLAKDYPIAARSLLFAVEKKCWDSSELEAKSHALYDQIVRKGISHLFQCPVGGHALGVCLSKNQKSKKFINIQIFNSGEGIEVHLRNNGKFETQLSLEIPIDKLSSAMIRKLLDPSAAFKTIADFYTFMLTLEGVQKVIDPTKPTVWQTAQKGGNCTVEWIFAYLKQTMTPVDYNQMRLKLFQDCIQAARAAWGATDDHPIIRELNRKVTKRQRRALLLANNPSS